MSYTKSRPTVTCMECMEQQSRAVFTLGTSKHRHSKCEECIVNLTTMAHNSSLMVYSFLVSCDAGGNTWGDHLFRVQPSWTRSVLVGCGTGFAGWSGVSWRIRVCWWERVIYSWDSIKNEILRLDVRHSLSLLLRIRLWLVLSNNTTLLLSNAGKKVRPNIRNGSGQCSQMI